MPKNYCIMQIWAESGKSALPICLFTSLISVFNVYTKLETVSSFMITSLKISSYLA